MVVNIPIVSQIGFIPFTILANGIYKRADAICAVSNTYVNQALEVNKRGEKLSKILYVITVASTMPFFKSIIRELVDMGNKMFLRIDNGFT